MSVRRGLGWFLVGSSLMGLTGCNGPKSSCEGTMNSWKGCINSNDWDCMSELINPVHRRKYGRGIKAISEDTYKGAYNFKYKFIQADETGNICIARTNAFYTVKVRGKSPEDFDDQGFSYTLRKIDGLWYIDFPGVEKLSGF